MQYTMTNPCNNCPFRREGGTRLSPERVLEVVDLERGEFPCHKTVDYTKNPDGDVPDDAQHCAGALIFLEKQGIPSQMMRVCGRLEMYDSTKLDMKADVFDNVDEMLKKNAEGVFRPGHAFRRGRNKPKKKGKK